jgi:lysophospholipase L1-like esterase
MHRISSCPPFLKDYKKSITEIVDQAEKKKIKVILMTSSMIGENLKWKLNDDLAPYNEFIRELAKERGYPLAEINGAMQKKLKEIPDVKGKGHLMATGSYKHHVKNKLTRDGVHMNALGNIMMAKEVLRAMGMSESDIEKAAAKW